MRVYQLSTCTFVFPSQRKAKSLQHPRVKTREERQFSFWQNERKKWLMFLTQFPSSPLPFSLIFLYYCVAGKSRKEGLLSPVVQCGITWCNERISAPENSGRGKDFGRKQGIYCRWWTYFHQRSWRSFQFGFCWDFFLKEVIGFMLIRGMPALLVLLLVIADGLHGLFLVHESVHVVFVGRIQLVKLTFFDPTCQMQ